MCLENGVFAPYRKQVVLTKNGENDDVHSGTDMTGRPGYRTMEMIGGSSAPYLARTPCVPLFSASFNRVGNKERFRLPGAGGGSFPLYGGTFARSYSVSMYILPTRTRGCAPRRPETDENGGCPSDKTTVCHPRSLGVRPREQILAVFVGFPCFSKTAGKRRSGYRNKHTQLCTCSLGMTAVWLSQTRLYWSIRFEAL